MHFLYLLQLADNAHILSQRLAEWCGHGPVLEQDIALTNIALDLLGQARMLYTHAAAVEGQGRDEDQMAYFRNERAYRNVLLVEQPNGDWASTIARQFFFDAWSYHHYRALLRSTDAQLAAIAEKSLKEVTYHLRYSSEWVLRLGDGTDTSHQKMQRAIDDLWPYTGELCQPSAADRWAAEQGIGADLAAVRPLWHQKVAEILDEATLTLPPADVFMQEGGKEGRHTEHLGYMLTEMQYLQRSHPGLQW